MSPLTSNARVAGDLRPDGPAPGTAAPGIVLLMFFCVLLAPVAMQAATFSVTGSPADYELDESLVVGNLTGTTLRCGATSATTPGGRNAIFIFALPVIGATNQVAGATLNFNYASKSGSPAFNADLWGIGFHADTMPVTNVFLKADADTNAADVKLQDNVLTPVSATGAVASSDFSSYLQGFYATNSGYSGGSYVFLRVNPDADPGNVIVGYNVNSADSASQPVLTLVATNAASPSATNLFVHPGLLHTQAELDRMRQMVAQGVEPWASAFVRLANDPHSQANYTIAWQPTTNFYVMGRGSNPGDNVNKDAVESDCSAAYQLALMWCITSNSAYAQKAIQILNDWSSSLTNIIGTDAILAAGLDGDKFVNAAELLRYSNAGWAAPDIAQFSAMMTNVFYPVIANFATFANGNWDAGCEKTMLGIGIFCERPDLFSRATNYFYTGAGCGALTNYIYPNGQCQESGRDQTHTQLGLGHLAELCEMAWHQGADLYGACSNRLLAGFEYTARYNLGYGVPYTPAAFTGWSNGIWFSTAIATNNRGELRPVYEMVYHHYVNRRGLPAPFTAQIATNILSPEGPWLYADHPGFGTLSFSSLPRTNAPGRIEAESYSTMSGVRTETCAEGGSDVTGISTNDYLSFANVNLTGVQSFSARVACPAYAGAIEVRADGVNGALLGTCAVPLTGNAQFWSTVACNLAPMSGMHNLFLIFRGNTSATTFNLNWFALNPARAFPQTGSNLLVRATNILTAVDLGGQPAGTNIFGGEFVTNNAPDQGFPVGTNFVLWISTNLSGNVVTLTQTVTVVAAADAPTGLAAVPGDGLVALNWNAATNAGNYNVKQSTAGNGPFTVVAAGVATPHYTAGNLVNGTLYYFTVSSTNQFGESGNCPAVSARPTSLAPPSLGIQAGTTSLQFNWPADHTGWRLLAQTNPLGAGLGTNWFTVPGSPDTNAVQLPLSVTNTCVFYRLIYP